MARPGRIIIIITVKAGVGGVTTMNGVMRTGGTGTVTARPVHGWFM
jgi:hypothetical protein